MDLVGVAYYWSHEDFSTRKPAGYSSTTRGSWNMIDFLILGKLVDRLIDLVKRREEMNHALFTNFVQRSRLLMPSTQTTSIR